MGQPVKSKYTIEPPDTASKYTIEPPDAPVGVHNIGAKPFLLSMRGIKSALYTGADKVTNALPSIGGIGGGIIGAGAGAVGGPVTAAGGGIAGASIGGAGGEATRQLSRRALGFEVPKTSSDAAEQIGGEGLRQGAYEAGGQVFGRLGRVLSPKLAEAAVAPGKRLLKSIPPDVNIGRTILDESKGIKLPKIVKSLDTNIANASDSVSTAAATAKRRGATVDLTPARNIADSERGIAAARNSPSYIRDVGKVNDQLTTQFGANGKPLVALPTAVDPVRARALKQGIDTEIGNWNPEAQSAIAPLQQRVRGVLNEGFHIATPGTAELDKRMTSMIPARDAAWNSRFNPGITRGLVDRIARPTGSLIGGVAGAKEGYDQGGIGGAMVGGAAGLAIPHYITSPTGLMLGARALENQVPSKALRYTLPFAESQRKRLGEEKRD